MRVIYIPFNNKNFAIWKEPDNVAVEILSDIYSQMEEKHMKEGEQCTVIMYLAANHHDLTDALRLVKTPSWVTKKSVVLCEKFDVNEADSLASAAAEGVMDDIVCFRLIPFEKLTPDEIKNVLKRDEAKWGCAYAIEVPWNEPEKRTASTTS